MPHYEDNDNINVNDEVGNTNGNVRYFESLTRGLVREFDIMWTEYVYTWRGGYDPELLPVLQLEMAVFRDDIVARRARAYNAQANGHENAVEIQEIENVLNHVDERARLVDLDLIQVGLTPPSDSGIESEPEDLYTEAESSSDDNDFGNQGEPSSNYHDYRNGGEPSSEDSPVQDSASIQSSVSNNVAEPISDNPIVQDSASIQPSVSNNVAEASSDNPPVQDPTSIQPSVYNNLADSSSANPPVQDSASIQPSVSNVTESSSVLYSCNKRKRSDESSFDEEALYPSKKRKMNDDSSLDGEGSDNVAESSSGSDNVAESSSDLDNSKKRKMNDDSSSDDEGSDNGPESSSDWGGLDKIDIDSLSDSDIEVEKSGSDSKITNDSSVLSNSNKIDTSVGPEIEAQKDSANLFDNIDLDSVFDHIDWDSVFDIIDFFNSISSFF